MRGSRPEYKGARGIAARGAGECGGRRSEEMRMAWHTSRWMRRSQLARSTRIAWLLITTLLTIYKERSRVVKAQARGDFDAEPDI
jgi:hypothetical protein